MRLSAGGTVVGSGETLGGEGGGVDGGPSGPIVIVISGSDDHVTGGTVSAVGNESGTGFGASP
jgi:hypothetical protein